ncbi:MAG: universal stress protein [Thiobacillus sp.]
MPETRPYRRVLALIGFDANDALVARKAATLAHLNHAELDFLHLIAPDALLDGGYAGGSPRATAREFEQAALRRLRFLAAQCGAGEAQCHAVYGPRRQGFAHHLEARDAELVVTAEPVFCPAGAYDLLVLGRKKPRRARRVLNLLWNVVAPARAIARI